MAKRKDSVALFEVITAAKRKSAAAEREQPLLGAPKGWFRGRSGQGAGSQDQDPSPDGMVAVALPPAQAFGHLPPPSEQAPADGPVPAVVHRVVPTAYAVPAEQVDEPEPPSRMVEIPGPESDRPRRAWFGFGIEQLGLDRDRQEVTVRVRYATAILAGFAVLVAIGLAYVAGRRSTSPVVGPNPASTEEIRRGPVLAGVLDVGAGRATTTDVPAGPVQPGADASGRPFRSRAARPDPGGGAPAPPVPSRPDANIETRLPRVFGLNYVIIQSYPRRADAEAAREDLEAAGIPCTVERAPKGWSPANPSLWSVIGTHGFAKLQSTPQYRSYIDSIAAVSKTFAGRSKYREFDPTPRKWQ